MATKKTTKRIDTAAVQHKDPKHPKAVNLLWLIGGETAAMFGILGSKPALLLRGISAKQAEEIVNQVFPKAEVSALGPPSIDFGENPMHFPGRRRRRLH